ncbi:MAG: DUF2505 domain-containing protein [Acidimicrobiales bacterium]|jgi:hypothetical protein
MQLKGSTTYAAPTDAVVAMLRDPNATVSKYETIGHRDVEMLACAETDGVLHIESKRVVDVDLPGFAKRVLKPTNRMHQTDEWREGTGGTWDGTFDVEVQGAPIHISGTMRLTPDGDSTRHDVTIEVIANVPFIGGRLADWAGNNDVRKSLDGEFACNAGWLAEHAAHAAKAPTARRKAR